MSSPMSNKSISSTSHESIARELIKKIIREGLAADMALGGSEVQSSTGNDSTENFGLDLERMKIFLQKAGLSGHEDEFLSILEGMPSPSVLAALDQHMKFQGIDGNPANLDVKTMLSYFIEFNGMDIKPSDILGFMIKA